MERRSLEYFRAVAESGTVSAAAMRLSVTQPAVSKQISRLESRLSLKLFHRTSSGMAMTAAGHALYELGGDLLTRFERAEGTLRTRFSGSPAFRVACPHTTATVLITPFMVDTDPAIVDLLIVTAPEVDGMLERDADIAISTMRPPPHRRQMVVAVLPITVQGSPPAMESRFGASAVGDLERLTDESVLIPRTGVHVTVNEATADFDPPLTVRNTSTGYVAQALAANDHGFALATEQVNYGLRSLPAYAAGKPILSPIYASWDVQHYATAELRKLARSFSRWMTVTPPWGAKEDAAESTVQT